MGLIYHCTAVTGRGQVFDKHLLNEWMNQRWFPTCGHCSHFSWKTGRFGNIRLTFSWTHCCMELTGSSPIYEVVNIVYFNWVSTQPTLVVFRPTWHLFATFCVCLVHFHPVPSSLVQRLAHTRCCNRWASWVLTMERSKKRCDSKQQI